MNDNLSEQPAFLFVFPPFRERRISSRREKIAFGQMSQPKP